MGKYVVYGTRYLDYSIEVEAGSKDEAREVALETPLTDWSDNSNKNLDIYDVLEGGHDENGYG